MIARPKHFEYKLDVKAEREKAMEEANLPEELREFSRALSNYDPFFTDASEYCFYCGQKLTLPAVMWHGYHEKLKHESSEVWCHPDCVEQLCMKLLRDCEELSTGKQEADQKLKAWKADHPHDR